MGKRLSDKDKRAAGLAAAMQVRLNYILDSDRDRFGKDHQPIQKFYYFAMPGGKVLEAADIEIDSDLKTGDVACKYFAGVGWKCWPEPTGIEGDLFVMLEYSPTPYSLDFDRPSGDYWQCKKVIVWDAYQNKMADKIPIDEDLWFDSNKKEYASFPCCTGYIRDWLTNDVEQAGPYPRVNDQVHLWHRLSYGVTPTANYYVSEDGETTITGNYGANSVQVENTFGDDDDHYTSSWSLAVTHSSLLQGPWVGDYFADVSYPERRVYPRGYVASQYFIPFNTLYDGGVTTEGAWDSVNLITTKVRFYQSPISREKISEFLSFSTILGNTANINISYMWNYNYGSGPVGEQATYLFLFKTIEGAYSIENRFIFGIDVLGYRREYHTEFSYTAGTGAQPLHGPDFEVGDDYYTKGFDSLQVKAFCATELTDEQLLGDPADIPLNAAFGSAVEDFIRWLDDRGELRLSVGSHYSVFYPYLIKEL